MNDASGTGAGTGSGAGPDLRQLATGLGLFSIGLGLWEMLAPHQLSRALGLEGRETLIRSYGLREVATGAAILASTDPTPWLWGRVAGDALDLVTLAQVPRPDGRQKSNVAVATAAVLGVTALDILCAGSLSLQGDAGPASSQPSSGQTGTSDRSRSGLDASTVRRDGMGSGQPRARLQIGQSSPALILIYDQAAGHEFRFRVDSRGGVRILGAFAPRWADGREPSAGANYLFEARQLAEREAADQGWIDG